MSWEFGTFIVAALIAAIGGVVYARSRPDSDGRAIGGASFAIFSLIAALFFVLGSFTIVGTKNIGIQTAFNRPVGTMANGWNWKAPWTEVTEWDGKLQNLRFSDTDEHDDGRGISVRLGNQSTATVDLILQYRLTTDAGVLELYRQYGSEASLRDNLVRKALQSSLNEAFKSYDPITALASTDGREAPKGMPELAAQALTLLRAQMPPGIEVVGLTIVMPHYDATTEERIKAFNTAVQDTAIAKQREQTAEAIRAANAILAQGNASDAVLYQNCLDMVERVVKGGGSLPAGFSCQPGGGVVIPSAK